MGKIAVKVLLLPVLYGILLSYTDILLSFTCKKGQTREKLSDVIHRQGLKPITASEYKD